jgi:HAD superfamily hydrolase (TIGR01509 family)
LKDFDAVIFDMDGVIFDSERATLLCWLELSKEKNFENIYEVFLKCTGTTMEKTKSIVLEAYGDDFPYDEYASLASKMYHARYDGGKLPVKKGVKDILEYLKENNKKIALASSSRKETVEKELRDAGIYSFFDEIVTGDMVNRSKPEPDIFLKACEAVGVKPDRAYAIEDSYNGIRAAFRGGLKPIMVPDLLEADDEMKKLSDKVLNDLNAVIGYLNE